MFKFEIEGGNHGAEISVDTLRSGEITLAQIKLHMDETVVPEKVSIKFKLPDINCYSTWSPNIGAPRNLGPNWSKKRTTSRLASGMPVHQLISAEDKNRLCIALSDTATPMTIGTGVCEEDACFDCVIELFTGLTAPIRDYSAIIRFDTRDIPFYDAIYDTVTWWETECGCTPAYVPDAARMPVDSLWYSFHQRLDVDGMIKECTLSKPLGMDTVIIDDGWQTEDNNRGYAYCGDWQVVHSKMGDMKELVDRIHAIGMKVMLWYSVPFVGKFSQKYEEFKDMLVEGWHNAYRFDPRYKAARDYLVSTYTKAVKDWGLDGLKLDFIDAFALSEESLKPDSRRDFVSLEEAIDALMTEVKDRLTEINPEIMIEFRQSYIGPSIRKYGNMLRVGDCPNDAFVNRRNIVDMRFTSGKTPVHSDMLMWHMDDSVQSAAMQIAATLYSVPQISVKIDKLSDEHLKMLKYYLGFWRVNRRVLLDGKITAADPETGYSLACATLGGEQIFTAYTNPVIDATVAKTTAVNCTRGGYLILKGCDGRRFIVTDCMGNEVASGVVRGNLYQVAVPLAGMVSTE